MSTIPNTESIFSKSVSQQFREEDNIYKFYVNDVENNISSFHFKDNRIDTTKYNIFTFIPKALLLQFVRLANIYFLICAILQCIPIISPLTPVTAVVPLVFVNSSNSCSSFSFRFISINHKRRHRRLFKSSIR